jgi:hypothetical protein
MTLKIYRGDRACLRLSEPRIIEGIWLNEFEGSRYFPDMRSLEQSRAAFDTAFNAHELLRGRGAGRLTFPPSLYRVRFIGRSAEARDGIWKGVIVVDEFLATEVLGPYREAR